MRPPSTPAAAPALHSVQTRPPLSDTRQLLARLDAEWRSTCDAHDGLAAEWAAAVPALAGCHRLDEVVACCADSDAATLAVLLRAQGGCPVAGRTILRVLVPLLAGLARRDTRADLGDYVGACWPVLMSHAPERRTSVLAALALDTRRAVVRERAGLWLVTPADPCAALLDTTPPPNHPESTSPALEATEVVRAARRLRLVPAASAEALDLVYVGGLSGRAAAARLGTSEHMVRYRCSTGVRRLRAARAALLDDITA